MKKLVIRILMAMVCAPLGAQTITLNHTQKDLGEVQLGTSVTDTILVTAEGLTGDIIVSEPECSGVMVSTYTITKEQAEEGYKFAVTLTPEDLETTSEVITFTVEDEASASYTLQWTPVEEKHDPVYPEHVLISLPYQETFSRADHYDGKSYLPKGWLATGSVPFITGYDTGAIAPQTGSYYMITKDSEEPRNEKVYTCFFDLKKGQQYTVSFYVYMPGEVYNYQQNYTNMDFAVSTEQDPKTIIDTLKTVKDESVPDWKLVEVKFCPEVDDEYCFSFLFSSENAYAGEIAVDNFQVTADGLIFPPTADFSFRTWLDGAATNTVVQLSRKPVHFTNLSTDAERYVWECKGAQPETSTEKDAEFIFPEEDMYVVKLTAYNAGGSDTFCDTIYAENFSALDKSALLRYTNEYDEERIKDYTDTPTFPTDEYDFISGINHYYMKFAERFEFSDYQEMTIKNIQWWMTSYSRQAIVAGNSSRDWPFSIVAYGEKDGTVDTDNVFGRKVSTVVSELGSMGVGLNNSKMASFNLSKNGTTVKDDITVHGNFYLAFEFDDSMPVESGDKQVERSYVCMGIDKHKNKETSLYCLPTSGPEGFTPDGKWHKVSDLGEEYAGYGLSMYLWCTIKKDPTARVEEVVIDAKGNMGRAYNLSGQQVGSDYRGVVIVNGKKIFR